MSDADRKGVSATCAECGASRSPEPGSCPECGGQKRDLTLNPEPLKVEVSVREASLSVAREWIEMNWPAVTVGAVLTVGGAVVGGGVGLAVGLLASVVGVKAFTKVREIDRR